MEDNMRKRMYIYTYTIYIYICMYVCMTESLLYSSNWNKVNQLYFNFLKNLFSKRRPLTLTIEMWTRWDAKWEIKGEITPTLTPKLQGALWRCTQAVPAGLKRLNLGLDHSSLIHSNTHIHSAIWHQRSLELEGVSSNFYSPSATHHHCQLTWPHHATPTVSGCNWTQPRWAPVQNL